MPIAGLGVTGFRGSVVAAGQYAVTATLPTPATTVSGFVGSLSVPGCLPGDIVLCAPATAKTVGVSYTATVTAADTVAVTVTNGSGGASTGGSTVMNILVLRLKLA